MVVAAAVVVRNDMFLITRRQAGVHLAGYWEFPGGKCENGEPLEACLVRELQEELLVGARVGEEIFTVTHAYEKGRVELHFFSCDLVGEPAPQLGQEMRWAARAELATFAFPPADASLIQMLTSGDPM